MNEKKKKEKKINHEELAKAENLMYIYCTWEDDKYLSLDIISCYNVTNSAQGRNENRW